MADYDRLDRYGRDDSSSRNRDNEGQGRFGRDYRNEDRPYGNQGNYGGSSAQYGQYDQGGYDRDDNGRGSYGRGSYGQESYGQGGYGQGNYGQDRSSQDRSNQGRYGQRDQSGHFGGYGQDYRNQGYRGRDNDRSQGLGTDYRSSYGTSGYDRGGDYAGNYGSSYGRRESSYGSSDYNRGYRNDYGRDDDRGFFERAGDEVRSWFGDDDAERRRRQDAYQGDEGAQHHRGRGPRNYSRSDDRVREDVNDRLTDDSYLDASDIDVSVSGGEVTLSGTVNNRSDKRRAEDVAERVSGVSHVQNNLRVKQNAGSSSSLMGGGTTTGSGLAGMSGSSEAGSSAASSGTKAGGLVSTTAVAGSERKAT